MKKLLLLFLPLLTCFACSSDDSNKENPNETGLKLKKVNYSIPFSDETGYETTYTTTTEYFYGSNGYANKTKTTGPSEQSVTYSNFEYKGDEIIQYEYEVANNEQKIKLDFMYKDGLIITSINTEIIGTFIKTYNYDASRNLIRLENRKDKETQLRSLTEFEYDANRNVSKRIETFLLDDSKAVTLNQYDNQHHPFSNVFPEAYLKTLFYGKNNIVSSSSQDGNTKVEYEYNDKGYPTKAIHSNMTVTYEYY